MLMKGIEHHTTYITSTTENAQIDFFIYVVHYFPMLHKGLPKSFHNQWATYNQSITGPTPGHSSHHPSTILHSGPLETTPRGLRLDR